MILIAGAWQPVMMASMFLTGKWYGGWIKRTENSAIRAAVTNANTQRNAAKRVAERSSVPIGRNVTDPLPMGEQHQLRNRQLERLRTRQLAAIRDRKSGPPKD